MSLMQWVALGVLVMMALLRASAGSADLTKSPPAMHLRYYFVVTFCLNLICASACSPLRICLPLHNLPTGLICWKIRRVNSSLSRSLSSSDREFSGGSATSHVFEVIIQSGASFVLFGRAMDY